MKKLIVLISLIVVECLFADVLNKRYEDGNVHYGLPSWVMLSDILAGSSEIDRPFNQLPDIFALNDNKFTFENDESNLDPRMKIDVPVSHIIEFLGKSYSIITVHEDGKVELGDAENEFDKLPYVKVASVLEQHKNVIGKNVEWGFVSQKVGDVLENFIVINFGPFTYPTVGYYGHPARLCSIQILIYQDGEVQVQYWYHDKKTYKYQDEWMTPEFFDGHDSRVADLNKNNKEKTEIYGENGLRPGWIAKALNTNYAVDITEPQMGAGLHVQMNSDSPDLGGIIAYDFSREHPVVGSISSIDVVSSDFSTENVSEIYCWYFNEYFNTYNANIPKWLPFDGRREYQYGEQNYVYYVPLNLSREDYDYTWEAYKTNPSGKNIVPRTDATLDFIRAPAFKFQRAQKKEDHREKIYDFYIKKITYNLAQPQSVQFLPLRSKCNFIVENSNGGMVDFPQIKGTSDDNNSYKKVYELYPGQDINGSIIAAPGYLIHKITLSNELDATNESVVYESDNLLLQSEMRLNFSIAMHQREIAVNGRMADASNVVLKVFYRKCESRLLDYVVPAMVKTETYTAPQSSQENRTFSSAKIMDAFGGVAQEQKKIENDEYLVSSEYSNGVHQTTRVPMNFVHKSQTGDFEYVDMACEGCIVEANAYYYKRSGSNQPSTISTDDDIDRPDAENNAFTEVRYFNGNSRNNGATSASAGIAKRSFVFNENSYAQDWEIPASSEYDYIPHEKLEESAILNIFNNRSNKASKKDFVLKIHRDAEGKFTQEIYNSIEQKVSSWFYNGNQELITIYDYDAYGNLIKTYNKDYNQISLNTVYDSQNRVESVQSNDRGLTQNRYDSKGRLRFVKTPLHGDGEFAANFFDKLGRTVAVGEVSGMSSTDFDNPDIVIPETQIKYVSKTIYGKPELDELVALGVNRSLASDILSKMKCIRPNDVGAVVAFDDNEKMVSIKLSEYNRIGEKKYQWIVLGLDNVPAVELSYEYNLSSELTSSTFSEWDGTKWNAVTTRTRCYDNQGRLVETKENGKPLAKYVYTPNGNVREKLYYDDDKLVFRKVISRDVYDRPTKIAYYDSEKNGKEMYSATLDFKSVQTNQVKKASHNWHSVKGGENPAKQNTYDYDYSGRLTSVSGDQNASYDFDALGRMVKKKEADTTINYLYSTLFYRPAGMSINDDSPSALGVYIQYDAAGNIWYDLHNKLVYKNGKNNMPSKVFLFSTMPQNITLDEVDALDDVNGSSPYLNDVTERIDIAYDDGGDRLWYSYNKLSDGSGMTRVTLPGVGVYEATKTNGVNGTFKLVRKDLVAGGYRDEAGHAHFPVMDAQGNVRGYATSDGIQSAYDYFAYGTVMDLSTDAGDDNKRWQDKEFDGEHGKYYFGARYFDPFFGMWMSPDPAGQFANPYTYGGDPVNGNDYKGLWFGFDDAIAAAVGAVVGFVSYSLTNLDDWHWERALAYTGIGAASGWLTWNTGGSTLAAAAQAEGGISANIGLGSAIGYGALSSGVGSGFTAAATYTEKAAYGDDGYSFANLRNNWDGEEFAMASTAGFLTGAFVGGVIAGTSWGISYGVNQQNQQFYNTPDEQLSEADRFVKKYKLRRSPVDKGWKSAGLKKNDPLVEATRNGSVDRTNPRDNFLLKSRANKIARAGFCGGGSCQRFEGGLHVVVPKTGGIGGHYDFFDAAKGPEYLLGHFLEVAIGKTIKESSVSWLELGIIAPLMNGFLFDW